ncbi:MAG TPA: hypothetical protein VLA09_10175, partial [Longimicrobiales bacterium]|nr:hypothetical protein [Longimicrobiales bacterium]
MRRLRLRVLSLALVSVAACQDAVTPPIPDAPLAPSLSVQQQQADRVVPGRVLAQLADGADPAEVALA